MSDESDIESLHSLTNRKKRKPRIVDDSDSSDSDSSIDNVSRRKRVFKVNSDEESDSSDSEPVPVRPKNKTLRVVSDESLGSDNSSWESDSSSNSETESPSTSQPGPSSAAIINNAALLSDSSDGQSDKCPICLISFSNQEIGTPEVCDHDFCAECIQEWSRNVNTCPVDRQEFSLILVRRRLNGKVVRRVPVEKRRPEGEENIDLDPTFCEVCGQSDREDRMLLCDSCDLGYHLECLDPPLESVPIDEWYCSDCRGGDTYGLEETYENSSRTTRRRITPSSVPRLVPRTRQAERVRANIVNQRVERETVNRSGVDFDQPSTSSGFESSNIGTVHRSSQTTLRRRATTTTVSKRKKRKRRAKRRNRTKTVEYEIDEESGKKFALKKKVIKRRKKRKTRRKKLREKRVIVPKTVKKRLASQLGICPLKNAKQMIPDVKNNTHSNGIAFQRYQAGIPTLNLFGNRDDLDYFSDSDDDMLAGDGGVVSLASRSRHYLMSAGNHARLKNISIQSPPCASTACDILSGILDSQSKLHSKNSVLSLDRDGTVLVEDLSIKNKIPETNETPNTPDSNDLELGNSKIDINDNNAINDRVTQNPMYPGYGGGGGNRPPYNFGRGSSGGYRGNYNSGGNYGNGSMFNSRGRGTGGFDPRDGRAMYTDYLHRGPSPAHRGIPPFQRGRGAPRFPRRPPNQGMEFNYRDPDEREIDLSMSVQENQVSRSTEPHPDTSVGHTQPQQNERFEEDEFDIYSDIETSASRDDPEPVGVNEAVPVLAPPPVPPMLPGIIYGSDSEENNSDTELVIDDAVKADAVYDSEENNSVAVCTVGDAGKAEGDEYDPAKPSGDTDSEPDTTNAANLNSDSAVASTSNAFDNSISDNSIIGPQLPEEVRISQEEEDNVENVAVVQPRIVILQQENVDTNNEGECPNFSVYAKDTENIENEERVNQQSDDDSKDDCPNFSIYSAESMDIAKTTEQALPISLDVTSGGDLEPDSVQNAEVESSTKDFDIAPQHADVSNSDEPDSIENEPDSNNMEKENVNKDEDDGPSSPSLPQVLLTETENQSEEISTTQNDVDYESKTGKNEELKPNEQPSSTIRKKIDIMFKPNMQRVLQLYDDSDFEDWSESNEKSMEEEKIKNNEVVEKSKSNTNVIEGIETEAVSEEERSYTPCLDENKIESEPGIGGMDTELVSEEEKNDFDESHEMKTASDGEALEINAKENELELTVRLDEYEEGEIIEGKKRATNKSPVTVTDDKKKETEKKKPKDDDKRKEKKKSENASFKKVSRSNKERNYRDRERSRSRDKKNKNDKKDGRQKKEKRKELERYDVRNVVGQKIAKKNFADVFGRNESRERSPSPVRVRSTSRSRRSRSLRSVSRERVSPARFRRSLSRRRRSGSRGRVSPLRKRPSPIRGGRRSLSRPRRSLSRTRRSLSRGKKSVSPAKDKRMRKSWSRSRSRSRGRIARKSRSRSPRLRKRRHRSKEKSRQKRKSEERGKSKKTRRRNRSSSPDKHRLSRSVSIPCRNQEQDDWQPGYVREWSPSWSRSPTPRMHRTMPNASPSWTPPVHHNGGNNIEPENLTVILTNNDAMKKKKDKRKKSDKRGKEITAGKKRKRGDRTPPPSKEVFASGDNILVSVSFNKTNEENDQQVSTREVVGTKRKRDNQSNDISKRSKKDKSVKDRNKKGDKKKSKKVKEASNMKPVAIIDLERSPFKEITPSPKDVIVLSDSDSGEKEAELMQRQGILQEELLEMGSQEEIDSVLQSPRENYINQSSGPKTPPEPQIKFHIQKPQQSLRNISNPLHEEQEDGAEGEEMDPQEELEMRLNEVMHKGPNTPPEPPASPPSSPDAYDPFEPTKSRSPSPEPTTQAPSSPVQKPPVDVVESDASLGDLAVCPLESSQKSNETQEPRSSSLERVMTIMASKRVGNSPEKSAHSPIPNTEQDSQIISSETSSAKDNNAISVVINQTIQPPPSSVFSAVVKPSVSVYSSVNPTMVTSTPIIQNVTAPRTSIFNTMPTSVPQRVVHPTPSKSTPVKPSPLKSAPVTKGPIKSTPIKPMPSKTIISKLPLPITKPYNQRNMPKNKNTSKNRGQNGNEIIDVDLDFDSPYSPGSSDYEDLFEPPVDNIKNTTPLKNTNQMKNTKSPAKVNPFDTLFGGGSPVYKNNNNKKQKVSSATKVPVKYNKKNVKGTKNQIGVKLDEDSLKILDDLPNSAVEMQVKDKFLKKLNRQERVVEEVKLVLKPHYNKKHVTKEQYKDILRRAVPKICHNKSGEINPKKIQCLIEAYVKKARAMNRKNSSGAVSNPTLVQPKTTKSAFWS